MHFVQLLSSIFFSNPGATRNLDADGAWLLVSYLYQKEKQDFFAIVNGHVQAAKP